MNTQKILVNDADKDRDPSVSTAHSPLPWKLEDGRAMIGEALDGKPVFGTSVATIRSRSEVEANAAFIVRAVNEYAQDKQTIKDLVAALGTSIPHISGSVLAHYPQIEAALAKARQ